MVLYFIRHGRQSSRLCNVDVDLALEGVKQAEQLGKRLKQVKIDAMYSSDLLRAIQTADVLNCYIGNLNYRIRTELREIDFGDLTGNSDEYNDTVYAEFKKERMEMEKDLRFPSGECGQDVMNRIGSILTEIIQSGKERVAVVTHGGVIRSMVTHALGLPQAKKLMFATTLENTSITELTFDQTCQRYYLERFNDFAHLEGYPELLRKQW